MTNSAKKAAEQFEELLTDEVPVVYANGFSIRLTNADVVLVLALSNRPIQQIHLSYTLAKTLHIKLADVVDKFETAVGKKMLTTDQVDESLSHLVRKE